MLHLSGNHISNIYSLSSFTKLNSLYLHDNQITDIQPLATNSGLSAGDIVTLAGNPLSSTSVNDYVPQLEKKGVIVLVYSTPQDVYKDDFSNPASGWPAVSNDQYEVSYKNSEYHFTEKKGGLSFLSNRSAGPFADFILEADVRLVSGPNQNAFGMIFRTLDTQQDFYFFKVTANGYFVVGKRLNGIPQVILNKESEYLQKDYNTNHLTVICKGSKVVLYVNWNYLTTITDDSFAKGYIGVSIGPGTSELATTVAFDNIRITDISTHSP
jgi:Leucine-rich repeat (LRR) protein